MLTVFKAIEGQSVVDLVLNTYGSFNQLGKFITDNGFTDLNGVSDTNQDFVYDTELVEDQNLYEYILQFNTKFRTGIGLIEFILTESSITLQPETAQNFRR